MSFKIKEVRIKIEWIFIIVFFINIFSITFRKYMEMYYICFFFIIFHEMAHVFVAVILGRKVSNINLSLCGISVGFKSNIDCFLSNIKNKTGSDIIIYSAGPIASYLLAVIFKDIRMVYEINMTFFLINLLPIYPLDGYNIVKKLLTFIKKNKVRGIILKIISMTFLSVFLTLIIIFTIRYQNYNYFIFMLYILSINITE